jgi:transposase
MRAQWAEIDRRIAAFDNESLHAKENEAVRPTGYDSGHFGALNAVALIAAIGSGVALARGRDLAAWLGLVPRQITTGRRPRLVGITKRGNKYLRKLLLSF